MISSIIVFKFDDMVQHALLFRNPLIHALSRRGLRFENAVATSTCATDNTRSLLSGVQQNGTTRPELTLFRLLRTRGYRVQSFVSTPEMAEVVTADSDHVEYLTLGEHLLEQLPELLEDALAQETPTLNFFHLSRTHLQTAEHALEQAIADHLQAQSNFDSSLVVCAGDIAPLPQRGVSARKRYNDRVPLLISFPKKFSGSRIVTQQVRLADVTPTLLDLLDIPRGDIPFQGQTLLSAFRGEELPFLPAAIRSSGDQEETDAYVALRLQWQNETLKIYWNEQDRRFEIYNVTRDPKETTDIFS